MSRRIAGIAAPGHILTLYILRQPESAFSYTVHMVRLHLLLHSW